jgi:hypothetical protein
MVGGVDYATAFVEVRARGGQAATLAALQDVEASLAFWLLGLDCQRRGVFELRSFRLLPEAASSRRLACWS